MLADVSIFFDTLSESPLDASAKARITISGLAGCYLDANISQICFLRHDSKHELKLIVEGREQDHPGNVLWPRQQFGIGDRDPISVAVAGTNGPVPLEAEGVGNPLSDMMNFHRVHDGPVNLKLPNKVSTLDLIACSFYTHDTYAEGIFDLIQKGNVANRRPTKVGYVLGGIINGLPESMVTVSGKPFNHGKLDLPGKIHDVPVVYDLHFSNHCQGTELAGCKRDASNHDNTDFGMYYDVYEERRKPARTFHLTPVAPLNKDTSEIPACNPVIVEPPPAR